MNFFQNELCGTVKKPVLVLQITGWFYPRSAPALTEDRQIAFCSHQNVLPVPVIVDILFQ